MKKNRMGHIAGAAIGICTALVGIVFISLLFNLIPTAIVWAILVKALRFNFTFWDTFWWMFLASFALSLIKSGSKKRK